jgi:predicted NUDIX family NTP pyrophosphohydrolase
MVSITLSVSDEVRGIMRKFPEVNWSALVRKSIEEKAKILIVKQEMLKKLDSEKEFNDWAVNLIRKGRKKH